ncbi:MAG TPA: paraquat-inducible membrane protein A [Thiothrix sp.]|nr:paraquat-inducible membrane protein A [Thiothrix sp.]
MTSIDRTFVRESASALTLGLIGCKHCHTVSRLPASLPITRKHHKNVLRCPCCQAHLQSRIPNSLSKTWALLLAAAFMYIPANILPIMNVTYLGTGQPDTIMQGIIHLIEGGMWPLALIVFVASIVIPFLKLLVMAGLLLSVHFRSHWRPIERKKLFHITEFVGRWSMVDIFVVAILVALVQFGNIASVDAGLGALSFAVVVVLTMFAAHTFDPRLIWDAMETDNTKNTENMENKDKSHG